MVVHLIAVWVMANLAFLALNKMKHWLINPENLDLYHFYGGWYYVGVEWLYISPDKSSMSPRLESKATLLRTITAKASYLLYTLFSHKRLVEVGVLVVGLGNVLSPMYLALLFYRTAMTHLAATSSQATSEAYGSSYVVPVVPGLNFPMSHAITFLACTLLVVTTHELGHAVSATAERVAIQSFGIVLYGMFPAAYVKVDKGLRSIPLTAQLRVMSAGVWSNVVLSILCLGLLATLPVLLGLLGFVPAAGTVIQYTTSDDLQPGNIILSIDRHVVSSPESYQRWKKSPDIKESIHIVGPALRSSLLTQLSRLDAWNHSEDGQLTVSTSTSTGTLSPLFVSRGLCQDSQESNISMSEAASDLLVCCGRFFGLRSERGVSGTRGSCAVMSNLLDGDQQRLSYHLRCIGQSSSSLLGRRRLRLAQPAIAHTQTHTQTQALSVPKNLRTTELTLPNNHISTPVMSQPYCTGPAECHSLSCVRPMSTRPTLIVSFMDSPLKPATKVVVVDADDVLLSTSVHVGSYGWIGPTVRDLMRVGVPESLARTFMTWVLGLPDTLVLGLRLTAQLSTSVVVVNSMPIYTLDGQYTSEIFCQLAFPKRWRIISSCIISFTTALFILNIVGSVIFSSVVFTVPSS